MKEKKNMREKIWKFELIYDIIVGEKIGVDWDFELEILL